jgi:hypothetical protein
MADTSRRPRTGRGTYETAISGFFGRISDERASSLLSRSLLSPERLSLSLTGRVPSRRRASLGRAADDEEALNARHGEERIANGRAADKQNEVMPGIRAKHNRRVR